ncbi:pyrroline-5-carboxylate reductase family protein [Rickettsiella grylli]|uniref:pyrroline-5-carboxylate reductase family protein n=1 Tax=Rickettsiella grylli TaxID=59196 RepID=UPI0030842531
MAEFIFNAIGTVVWLSNEEQVDLVAALTGSGPAYFFLWMETLENAANELGLSKEMAHALTLQTALGSARMAIETKKNLTQLRQQVTSPGGTTEKAIESLNAAHLDDIIKKALTAAQNRAKELAQTF